MPFAHPTITSAYLRLPSTRGQPVLLKAQVAHNGSAWVSTATLADVFEVTPEAIEETVRQIYHDGEVPPPALDPWRPQNLHPSEVLPSLVMHLKSPVAKRLRHDWYGVLENVIIKGFAMDEQRLKTGDEAMEAVFFSEQIERLWEVRDSHRSFAQKITDLYMAASADYDKDSAVTQTLFGKVAQRFHHELNAVPQTPDREARLAAILLLFWQHAMRAIERQQVMTMRDWAKRFEGLFAMPLLELLEEDEKTVLATLQAALDKAGFELAMGSRPVNVVSASLDCLGG